MKTTKTLISRLSFSLLAVTILFILNSCATMTQTHIIAPRSEQIAMAPIKDVKIPYSVSRIDFDENEIRHDYRTVEGNIYEVHTGKYLKEVVNSLYASFDPDSDKSIGLYIRTRKIKVYKEPSAIEVILETFIYYDDVIFYRVLTDGFFATKNQLPLDYSLSDATQNAIIEAVKKIPSQVDEVLSNPEATRIRLKEDIERRLKTIPLRWPDSDDYAADYLALANLSRLTKHYDEAIAAAKRALEIMPKSYFILLKNCNSTSIRSKLCSNNSTYFLLLGLIFRDQGNVKEAELNFKKSLELDPKWIPGYIMLSQLYSGEGNYTEALNTIKKVLEVAPNSVVLLEYLAITYMSLGQFDQAINFLDKAISLSATEGKVDNKIAATAFAFRAFSNRELGRTEDFYKDAEKSYSLNPNNEWAKSAMALMLIDKGNYQKALEILSTSKERAPFDDVLRAIAYAKMGDMRKSADIYGALPEDYPLTRNKLKLRYISLLNDAIKPFKELKKQTIKNLEARGQYKEAVKEYIELIKISDDKEAKEIRTHIAELMVRYPHLFALSEEARKAVIRAEAYTSEGKFEEAIQEYKNAIKLSPFFPALYKALALSYGQIKQYKKAIANMQIYLDLYPDAPDARAVKDEIYRWEFMMEKGGK